MRKKLGDVFEVLLGDGTKAAFQYVANDSAQLGADVIQVSRCRWSGDAEGSAILADLRMDFQVEFFLHTTVKLGLRDGSWTKIGSLPFSSEYQGVWFKTSSDYGFGTSVMTSSRWRVFRVNQPLVEYGPVPTAVLPKEHLLDELGYMFSTASVRHRIEFGVYRGFHPQPTCGIDPKINNRV
jgi:hypothetical protein